MEDLFGTEDLRDLVAAGDGPHISILLPTHRSGPEIEQDRTRLKNLARRTESQLRNQGLRRPEIEELLAPVASLLEEGIFWQHLSDGLSLFLRPGWFRTFRVARELPELAVVSDRFHVKPLVPLLADDERFFILALSANQVRLFDATRRTVDELDPRSAPRSLAEVLPQEGSETEQQFHVASPREGPLYHGHGGGDEIKREALGRFLRRVDRGVLEAIPDPAAPLVLAGVDRMLSLYREVSEHPNVLGEGIVGNPELLRPAELRDRAWELVEPRVEAARRADADRYRELAGTGRTARDVREVVAAAEHGRVETLFVAVDAHRWGRLDESGLVELHEEPAPGDEDLLDRATVRSLLAGARIHAVPSEEVPDDPPVAAILRY